MLQHTESPTTAEQWSQRSDAEDIEVLACQADHDDLMAQIDHREALYETGQITWDEYCAWEFDYSPLPVLDPATASVGE